MYNALSLAESVSSNSTALRPSAYSIPASKAALKSSASCLSFFKPIGGAQSLLCRRRRARLLLLAACRFRNPRLLLPVHLHQRQAGVAGNDIEDRVGGIGRHAQAVHFLPRADAHVGRIQIRALLFELYAPPLGAFLFFEGPARAVVVDQIASSAVRASPFCATS